MKGNMVGKGVFVFASGSVYIGQFVNGEFHDENATFINKNGQERQATYINNKRIKWNN